MGKNKSSLQAAGLQPYRGHLNAYETATAIQAARINAVDLLHTAKELFDKELYTHSLVFSILAIEETGKLQILMGIFLGLDGAPDKPWSAYRRHTSKTEFFNSAIQSRAKVLFPDLDPIDLEKIKTNGPTPDEMDALKQLCLYSDCFISPTGVAVHLPRNHDWREKAKSCLGEAGVLVSYMRDYTPGELEIWEKHMSSAKKGGLHLIDIMKPLHDELIKKGFIKDGQWTPFWKSLNELTGYTVDDHENDSQW